MKFEREVIQAAVGAGNTYDVHPAAILAVIEVESAGKIYAVVGGQNEPLIRFEGHYFDRRLKGAALLEARAKGLANPNAGDVKNPATQAARWKMLARARDIDEQAAIESTSFGIGQVMGAHWKDLGYLSANSLLMEARSGVAGQLELMMLYIKIFGLLPAVKAKNWTNFARGYNGRAYKKNAYDTKLAAAYAKWSKFDFRTLEAPADKPKMVERLPEVADVPVQPPASPAPSPVKQMDALVSQKQPELIDKPVSDAPVAVKQSPFAAFAAFIARLLGRK